MDITLPELENVINFWRARRPASGEECALSPEVNTLASVYARMIFYRVTAVPLHELDAGTQELIQACQKRDPAPRSAAQG